MDTNKNEKGVNIDNAADALKNDKTAGKKPAAQNQGSTPNPGDPPEKEIEKKAPEPVKMDPPTIEQRVKYLKSLGFVLEGEYWNIPGEEVSVPNSMLEQLDEKRWHNRIPLIEEGIANIQEQIKERMQHEANVKKYGKDYVVAVKEIGAESRRTIFSRQSWNLLGANKKGWQQVQSSLPEVDELNAGKE